MTNKYEENIIKVIDLSYLWLLYENGLISFPEYLKESVKIAKPNKTLLGYVGGRK